jgi:hypothetical protein
VKNYFWQISVFEKKKGRVKNYSVEEAAEAVKPEA